MSEIQKSYKNWSEIYDTNENLTRDLDFKISKEYLSKVEFNSVLEIGCGTGKNTVWLSEISTKITAVDFSPEMLQLAKNKIKSTHVKFIQADISKPWNFKIEQVDLININLVLEHIENLDFIFSNAYNHLKEGGSLFISELHPHKQYLGSQAKFNNNLVMSFTHHLSDYLNSAKRNKLICSDIIESFDLNLNSDQIRIPRLLSILFKKN